MRKLTFTGSNEIGIRLMRECADTVKKVSMELGDNAPFIVFDDADIDAAVDGAMISKFRNNGQTCVCTNCFYVQDAVYDAFVDRLSARVKALKIGYGMDGVDVPPLIDERAIIKVEEHLADAIAGGATVLVGGKRSALGGPGELPRRSKSGWSASTPASFRPKSRRSAASSSLALAEMDRVTTWTTIWN